MSEFKDVLIRNVIFQWPRLDSGYVFNSTENKSEKVTTSTPGAEWSISFIVSHEEGQDLWKQAIAHFNECKKINSKLGKFGTIHAMKKLDDGTVQFTTRKSCITKKGTQSQPVKVIDAAKQPLADLSIWSGSTGNLKVSMLPTFNPKQEQWGIKLLLSAVQVIEAKYADQSDDFDAVDNGGDEVDPFGIPEDKQPDKQPAPTTPSFDLEIEGQEQAAKSDAVNPDMDDEIPF